MASTNKIQSYIIAEVAAMDIPLPFDGYLKPDGVNYYTLNEVNKTSLLGHYIDIRFSNDNTYFIHEDSNFSFNKGHFTTIVQMGTDTSLTVKILTTQEEIKAELAGTAGVDQIAVNGWESDVPSP